MQEQIVTRRNDRYLMILFFIMQVGNFIGYVSQAYEAEGIFSLISKGYILICFASFILCVLRHPEAMNRSRLVLLLIIMAVLGVMSAVASNWVGMMPFLILLWGYLSLPVYLIYTPYLPMRRSMVNQIKVFSLLTALFFVYCFFTRPEYAERVDAITFGYSNQNRLAIYLIQNLSILLSIAKGEKRKFSKIFFILICLFETYLVYLTYARIAYVCAIVLWLYFLRGNKVKIKKSTVLLFLVLPILFLIALIAVYNSGSISRTATLFDKPLFSGREEMYLSILQSMDLKTWLIGDFGRYQFGNWHNAFLTIICSIGVIGLLVFCLFFYWACMELRKYSENNCYKIMPFVGVLLLFVEGCAESATLVSGAMYASAAAQLVYLVHYGHRMVEEEQK